MERRVIKKASTVLLVESERIMAEIKAVPRVPVEFGVLRDSGHVEKPVITKGRVVVNMTFHVTPEMWAVSRPGEPYYDYALIQHERMDYHHPVGQAKYLSEPVLENVPRVNKALERALGKDLAKYFKV